MQIYGQLLSAQAEELASNPSNTPRGRFYYNTATGTLVYRDAVRSQWSHLGLPVGSIIAYHPGYFTAAGNSGFTLVGPGANTAAGVNTYLPACWRVCNGAALNDSDSPIFNGANRYLPDLTDDRFLMGDTAAGTTGGSNSSAHTHSVTSNVTVATQPAFTVDSHTHNFAHVHMWGHHEDDGSGNSTWTSLDDVDDSTSLIKGDGDEAAFLQEFSEGYGVTGPLQYTKSPTALTTDVNYYTTGAISAPSGAGSSVVTGAAAVNTTTRTADVALTNNAVTSGAASASENRPSYLQVFYIMKVK